MKITLSILLIFFVFVSFSQNLGDLGKLSFEATKSKAVTQYNSNPCEEEKNVFLKYCVEDGAFISYIFDKNILFCITFLTPYLTKTQAEKALENDVIDFSKNVGKFPIYSGGEAIFNVTSDLGAVFKLELFEGTYYVSYSSIYLK
jgi:hypothetical protein